MSDYSQTPLGKLHKEPPNLDDPLDVAWLAGLIEGEGYIGIYKNFFLDLHGREKRIKKVSISVKMTDKDIIERIAKLFGNLNICKINRAHPHHQDQWKVQAAGYRATIIIQKIFPYMGKRKGAKIREILEFYNMAIPMTYKGT